MPAIDFQRVLQSSSNAYMLLDRELRYVWANEAYLRITGARLEDLLGRLVIEVFPHDPDGPVHPNARLLRDSLQTVLDHGTTEVLALIPYRVPRSDGDREDRYWSATHSPVHDDNGHVAFVLQHATDVTEVHEAERARVEAGVLGRARRVQEANTLLDQERQHLRRLFDQSPGFVAIVSGPDHRFELANAAYAELTGHRVVIGRPMRECLPELEGQGWFERLDEVRATGRPYVARGASVSLRRDPVAPVEALLDLVLQPIVDVDGRVTAVFVQGHDITEQRRLEHERTDLRDRERAARAEAEEADRRQRFLAELIPQQVWTALPSGQLDLVNGRVLEYFGATAEQIMGAGWQDHLHSDDLAPCIEAWTRSLATGEEYDIEFRLRDRDGRYRWHLARALALRDDEGAIVKWFGSNTDIDDSKKATDEIARRAEFEQQLIGIVSHDLRNPLNAITMSATLLLRRGNLDEHQGRGVTRILSSSDRAARLIHDLLDFTRARSVGGIPIAPVDTNLRDLARHVVDELHVAYPDRQATVAHAGREGGRWDADRLAQLLGNLVTNAFQHSPVGAEIRVSTHGREDQVRIEVHNDGPPIPPADLDRLFGPFQRGTAAQQVSGRSIGLGLYIARLIVTAHHGAMHVTSDAATGTRFVVSLPWETDGTPAFSAESVTSG